MTSAYLSLTLQVAIALAGGDIFYFELDQMGQLVEGDKKEVRAASSRAFPLAMLCPSCFTDRGCL